MTHAPEASLVFIDDVAWDLLEQGQSGEARAHLAQTGNPYLEVNGYRWTYMPLFDHFNHLIKVVQGGAEAEQAYYEEVNHDPS